MTTTTTTPRKIAPPIPAAISGLPWVSNIGGLILGGVCYPRGCVIPDAVVTGCPNFDALHQNRRIIQRANVNEAIKPIAIEPSQPELRLAHVVIADRADCDDFLDQWKTSIALTMTASNVDEMRARDLLCGDHKGSDLFRKATRLASERAAIAKRLNGARPAVTI